MRSIIPNMAWGDIELESKMNTSLRSPTLEELGRVASYTGGRNGEVEAELDSG